MIQTYIEAAMERARYELIQDEEPYYGEVPEHVRLRHADGRTVTVPVHGARQLGIGKSDGGWPVVRLLSSTSTRNTCRRDGWR